MKKHFGFGLIVSLLILMMGVCGCTMIYQTTLNRKSL